MRNKTSGMLYVGQSVNLETRKYCGSGEYWVKHCKKHGGHTRDNIEIVDKFWAENKDEAQCWLDTFEKQNCDYFKRDNTFWANRALETTGDSAFCGIDTDDRKEYSLLGGLVTSRKYPALLVNLGKDQGRINAENGHMSRIQKIGASMGGKVAGLKNGKRAVESGDLARAAVLGGIAVCTVRHAEKDIESGKSLFAMKLGKASGETRKLMAKFCAEQGIIRPGVNYINVDRQAFKEWMKNHVS